MSSYAPQDKNPRYQDPLLEPPGDPGDPDHHDMDGFPADHPAENLYTSLPHSMRFQINHEEDAYSTPPQIDFPSPDMSADLESIPDTPSTINAPNSRALRIQAPRGIPDGGLLGYYLTYFQLPVYGTPEDFRRHIHAFRRGVQIEMQNHYPPDVIEEYLDKNLDYLKTLQANLIGIGRRFQLTGTRLPGVADSNDDRIFQPAKDKLPIPETTIIDRMVKAMEYHEKIYDLDGTKPHEHWKKLTTARFAAIANRLLIALKRTHAGYALSEIVDSYNFEQRLEAIIEVLQGCKGTIIRLDRPSTLEEVISHPRKMKQRFIDNQINNLKKKTGNRSLGTQLAHLRVQQNIIRTGKGAPRKNKESATQVSDMHPLDPDYDVPIEDDEDVTYKGHSKNKSLSNAQTARVAKVATLKARRRSHRNSYQGELSASVCEDEGDDANMSDAEEYLPPATSQNNGTVTSGESDQIIEDTMCDFGFGFIGVDDQGQCISGIPTQSQGNNVSELASETQGYFIANTLPGQDFSSQVEYPNWVTEQTGAITNALVYNDDVLQNSEAFSRILAHDWAKNQMENSEGCYDLEQFDSALVSENN